jgi:hypothetical protein
MDHVRSSNRTTKETPVPTRTFKTKNPLYIFLAIVGVLLLAALGLVVALAGPVLLAVGIVATVNDGPDFWRVLAIVLGALWTLASLVGYRASSHRRSS